MNFKFVSICAFIFVTGFLLGSFMQKDIFEKSLNGCGRIAYSIHDQLFNCEHQFAYVQDRYDHCKFLLGEKLCSE